MKTVVRNSGTEHHQRKGREDKTRKESLNKEKDKCEEYNRKRRGREDR